MGNQASAPVPGTTLQVFGAGWSRTGTASLSAALEILLDGPVYHCGTQVTLGPPHEIRSWIKLLDHWPPQDAADEKLVHETLAARLDGYAAVTDFPAARLVREMLALYPHAKVVVTTREPAAWARSMRAVSAAATTRFLSITLLLLPAMRHWPRYAAALQRQNYVLYAERPPYTEASYRAHMARLRELVPPERLVFFDVRDGWGPLCAALGKEVPDVPFPRLNDGEAINRLAARFVREGLVRWLGVLGLLGVLVVAMLMLGGKEKGGMLGSG